MDIRSSLEGLKNLLGVNPASGMDTSPQRAVQAGQGSQRNDRATLSTAGSEVAQAPAEPGVRADKVSRIQAALGAGTYQVPASDVASKLVDALLSQGR